MIDIVKQQLCYWADISAAGAINNQNGLGALTIAGPVASVYTLTMGANFSVPVNRRSVAVGVKSAAAAAGGQACYDQLASGALTILVNTYDAAGAAANRAFDLKVWRIIDEIGGGVG